MDVKNDPQLMTSENLQIISNPEIAAATNYKYDIRGQQCNQQNDTDQQSLVFCLDESLNDCKNMNHSVDKNDPFKVKVFSLSTKHDENGQVSVFMKEVFQGMLPCVNSNTNSRTSSEQVVSKGSTTSTSSRTGKCQTLTSGHGHSCKHCSKTFTRKGSLERHIKHIHLSQQAEYQCHTCSKSYKDQYSYRQHVRTKHDKIFRYTCKQCGKGCNRLMDYKVHLSTHTGKKLFKCDICSKEFLWKHYLTVHKRKHAGDFPFQCDMCSAKFHDSSRFIHHKRIHVQFKEVLKKHQCSYCKKKFETKRDVENHERTHTGVKPFSCTVCDKAYSAKSSLKEHMKTHGDKELLCPLCRKAFHKGFILKEHMKVHSEELTFVCQFCAKRYRYGSNLRSHEKSCIGKK